MRLKKWIWIGAGIVLTILAVILGLRIFGSRPRPSGSVVSFAYSHRGSSVDSIYSYTVREDEETGEMIVLYDLNCGSETCALPAGEEMMRELNALADAHTLWRWNGFDRTDSRVMDGSGFGLSIRYEDGTEISASGSNSFPEGYGEAARAIDALFTGYLKKSGIVPEGDN